VERAADDPGVVVTTYLGKHTHPCSAPVTGNLPPPPPPPPVVQGSSHAGGGMTQQVAAVKEELYWLAFTQ
jgi:hypothetical protein